MQWTLRLGLWGLLVAALVGCSAGHGGDAACTAAANGCLDGGAAGDARTSDMAVGNPSDYVAYAITPANPTVPSADGATPAQPLSATATRRDGTTVPGLAGTWSLADNTLGTIDPATGVFTANGVTAGTVQVQFIPASSSGATPAATTTLTVTITRTVLAAGTPASAAGYFTGTPATDPRRAVQLDYPLADAVMPQNVHAPDVQWEGDAAGDVLRVTFVKAHAQVTAYVLNTGGGFNSDWLVDTAAWHTLTASDPGQPLTLTVDRWDSHAGGNSALVAGTPRVFTVADAIVPGAVYYWWIDQGTIYTIDAEGDPSTALVPNPPPPPVNNDGSHDEPTSCIGCHAVSRDGRWLAGRLGGSGTVYDNSNGGGIFDLTDATALSANPAQYVPWPADMVQRWYWSAWNHDGSMLMVNSGYPNGSGDYDYELRILHMDPTTGGLLSADPSGDTAHLPRNNVAMPAWSPDDQLVAFVQFGMVSGERPSAFATSSLALVRATAGGTFGDPVVLHDNHGVANQVDAVPTFSPDSSWIAYGHGSFGRSNDPSSPTDALYLIAPSGGAPVRLDNANGGPTEADSWYPNFSPFDSGGYFWMVFFSQRDYGNAAAGTKGTGRRQLWVTAIDHHPDGTHDPSHPAYWLPGQQTSGQNITAFWAPAACRPDGATCASSAECCGNNCLPHLTAGFTCQAPTAGMCRQRGQTCGDAADCCTGGAGLLCLNNVCDLAPE